MLAFYVVQLSDYAIVDGTRYRILVKVDMMMSNFLSSGRFKINGKGKCMVVADSRHNAVRYFWAIKEYLKENPEDAIGCNVLVAFSGSVRFDNDKTEYTEASLNFDSDGKPINSDEKFRRAFRSSEFNILVVANKYQTGFDEPLLHSMYVDKKLKGVNAVQTLSRLNRTHRGKDDTFIMDFENSVKDIQDSFQPYYNAVYLEKETNPNKIYTLRAKLKKLVLYSNENVDEIFDFMQKHSDSKQRDRDLGILSSKLKPIVETYEEYDENKKHLVRSLVNKFINSYSYVTQIIRIDDNQLFREYTFLCELIRFLRTGPKPIIDISDLIKLEYSKLTETFSGQIALEKKDAKLEVNNSTNPKPIEENKDTLSRIIEKINEKYTGNFNDSERVIVDGILTRFMKDSEVEKFRKLARDNNKKMFLDSLFPEKFNKIVSQCYLENNQTFDKLFSDKDFQKTIMEQMGKILFEELKKETEEQSD